METDPPDPLDYAPATPGVTGRSFRLLLILTFINTLLLGVIVTGPIWIEAKTYFTNTWAAYQQRLAAQKTLAAYLTVQRQCLNYVPKQKLIYAEDPAGIAELLALQSAKRVGSWNSSYPIVPGVQWPLATTVAEPACERIIVEQPFIANQTSMSSNSGLLFMHERRATAASPPRLVVVFITAGYQSQTNSEMGATNYGIWTNRFIAAVTIKPVSTVATAMADPSVEFAQTDQFYLTTKTNKASLVTVQTPKNGKPGSIHVDLHGQMRVYAPVIDSHDPARFTLLYSLDGKSGAIDGRLLADDHVRLKFNGPLIIAINPGVASANPDVPNPSKRQATGPVPSMMK